MTAEQPDWIKQLNEAAAGFAAGMAQASRILAAQGAMGWTYRGDLAAARDALDKLGADHLQEISAAALASLADEALAKKAP